MKNIFIHLSIISVFFISCSEDDFNSDNTLKSVPEIEFNSIEFKSGDSEAKADTLLISIFYADLEGDIGLKENELNSPYNWKNYFSNKTGELFDFGTETIDDLLTINDINDIDTLPEFNKDSYRCYWDISPEIFYYDGTQLQDTVYFQYNIRHFNYLVNFYVENEEGVYKEFDFMERFCFDFNTRIPYINCDKCNKRVARWTVNKWNKSQGEIIAPLISSGFKPLFAGKNIKLRVTIIDRMMNFSNTIETDPIKIE